jgi:hypothetical protein
MNTMGYSEFSSGISYKYISLQMTIYKTKYD